MSLQPQATYGVPEETARVARAMFPSGNVVMPMDDQRDMRFHDADFADVFPMHGQRAKAPVRRARVTLLPFWGGLTDRQAADTVRTRIDGTYLRCLVLTDTGFDHIVLSALRTRLLAHTAERRLFDTVLMLAQDRGLRNAGGRQRSDSTHVLGVMRAMTRLAMVTETLRHTLNMVATRAPDWLRAQTTAAWVDRYGLRASAFRLPKRQAKRPAWAEHVGTDGRTLLIARYAATAPSDLRRLPAVETLRQVWIQNVQITDDKLHWRENDMHPPTGQSIDSPDDVDARYATKRQTHWVSDTIHRTETDADEPPNRVTNVETTNAAVSDAAVTERIHAACADRDLLPEKHGADTGSVHAPRFVARQTTYGIERIGPTRSDNYGQAKEGTGYAAAAFTIDWQQAHAFLANALCSAARTA